jgi:NIMA (never in mitosis gene a)-related kinase
MERGAKSTLVDFEIVKKVGEGAFSSVYQVVRKTDGFMYALKKVKIGQLKQREKENALNEIRILASIDHPHIVAYKDAFIDDKEDVLCIIMEFLAGGDLYHKITECKKQRALIPERLVWRYLIQMVRGLKHLHAMKIVHRDLKSANLFLSEDLRHIKLGDLNVSKVAKGRLVYTQTGTPYYASPEVWRDEPYDAKSDIWSLGCVVYEMCNRCPPFNARKMEELFAKVQKGNFERLAAIYSDDLQALVASLLRVSPVLRPSCDEILDSHSVKLRLREMEEDLGSLNDQALLLNTIRLTPNLKDLNRLLPDSKYDSDKKRPSSGRPERKETRESVSTAAEKVEQAQGRASASKTSSSRCQVPPSPKEVSSIQQPSAMVPKPLPMPQPVTGYMSPRQITTESRESRRSGRPGEQMDSHQSVDLQAEMLADRLQRMKEMIRSYEKDTRSPSVGQRQLNISRERTQVQNESREVVLTNGGRSSAKESVDVGRRKDSAEVNVQISNQRPAYYRPPQALKSEDETQMRRMSQERRYKAIPQSPTVRESSGSLRSRLLTHNSPTSQRKSENIPPSTSVRRDSGSRGRVKTADQYEDELVRRVEEEIVKKHAKRLLNFRSSPVTINNNLITLIKEWL